MSDIFLFLGHPAPSSFCHGLADAYERGAKAAGASVRRMNVHDMDFDPDLTFGYTQRKDLEPDLQAWREAISACKHMALIYPQWWGGMPAKMKGVFDRAYLPGFAMKYRETGLLWDPLLKGRSAETILTADTPSWYSNLVYGQPAGRQVSKIVLEYAGFKPVRFTQIAPIKTASDAQKARWLSKAETMGQKAGARHY